MGMEWEWEWNGNGNGMGMGMEWNGKHVGFLAGTLYDKKIESPARFPKQIGIICRQPLLS